MKSESAQALHRASHPPGALGALWVVGRVAAAAGRESWQIPRVPAAVPELGRAVVRSGGEEEPL